VIGKVQHGQRLAETVQVEAVEISVRSKKMRVRNQNHMIPSIEHKASSPGLFPIPRLLILDCPATEFRDSIGSDTDICRPVIAIMDSTWP
jgi:hypothetical protein